MFFKPTVSNRTYPSLYAFKRRSNMDEPRYTETDVFDKDGKRFSEKYGDLRKEYRERFFSSIPETKEEQKKDIEKDSENLTFESLFKQRDTH